jgi:hypothetical protein
MEHTSILERSIDLPIINAAKKNTRGFYSEKRGVVVVVII